MAEYTAITAQEVQTNQNVLFTDTPIPGTKCIIHRDGSGLVTLRGITDQCNARFLVQFNGNIAVPEDQTPGPISVAIALNGEVEPASVMSAYNSTAEIYWNVASALYVAVPKGCCLSLSVKNTSTIPISMQNANLIVTRVA